MDADSFSEWMAYDAIEPIDAAGTILKGLSGSGKEQSAGTPQRQTQGWEAAHAKMHKMATAGSKTILVPKGMTPEQVWKNMKDEW